MRHLFHDDYSEGAHPEILDCIVRNNDGQQIGYGYDDACSAAAKRICERFDVDADVYFIPTGTQANLTAVASMLRSFEGVITASSAHMANHEVGAIEATGHKVLAMETATGKLDPETIRRTVDDHRHIHKVKPGAVSLSQATEWGTVYSGEELAAVVGQAKAEGLRVHVDGARLSMALTSATSEMDPSDFARIGVDMFSIGGSKAGAMFGEALVIIDQEIRKHFWYYLKQRGGVLPKGRFLGLQFERFFAPDDLWLQIGRESNARAATLSASLERVGVKIASPTETNQVFATLPRSVASTLNEEFGFHEWQSIDDDTIVVRFVTTWATPGTAIDALVKRVSELL